MFFLRLLASLPLPLLHAIGVMLGWVMAHWPNREARLALRNLQLSGLCHGRGCKRLMRRTLAESGKGIMELAAVWLRPLEQVVRLVRGTSGWEQIEAAQAGDKGIILISPHIGCFEIINLYYAASRPFTAMYRPPRRAVLAPLMLGGRQRGQANLVPTDLSGVRALLRALKQGEAIGVLPDQVASEGEGVWAPFFGRPVYTQTLVSSLQRKTGAAVFLVAAERLSRGRGYHLHVVPVATPLPDDKEAAAACINGAVENMVRRFPEQYLWSYRRFKNPGRSISRPGSPS